MGFNDLPIIDKPKGNSERSAQKLQSFLNMQTGFVLREDVPDYGCDFDAELILDGGHASNQRFPIQVKSIEHLTLINEGAYISYAFETSRLGYLMRRLPAGGIIVLYSIERDECYFDYCDRIYERIMEEKQTKDWFANNHVNIHLPLSNLLTADSVQTLHQTFKNRFSQAAIMQNSMGRRYGLPSVISDKPSTYDFHNPDDVKSFLQRYGLILLNSYDLHITYNMIAGMPFNEIYSNKDLLLIATLSYGEMGMHAESKLFASRLSKYELEEELTLTLRFQALKNDFALGYIDTDQFIQTLEELSATDQLDHNKITIQINLINFKLLKKRALGPMPAAILEQINNVFNETEQLPVKHRTKEFLLLWNCENLSLYSSIMMSDILSDFAIRESFQYKVPATERQSAATQQISISNRFYELLHQLNKKAVANGDKVFNAYIFSLDVRHYISAQLNYVSFELPVDNVVDFQKRLFNKINLAAKAYATFLASGMANLAYDNLCNMIDLVELTEEGYKFSSPHNKQQLYNEKEKMEKLPEVISRDLVFPALLARKKFQREHPYSSTSFLKDFNDVQLEALARTTLQSNNLPDNQLPFILHEMKAHRLFDQRCTDPAIDFVQEQNLSGQYGKKARFILRNKRSGIISAPTVDMDHLLTEWGF